MSDRSDSSRDEGRFQGQNDRGGAGYSSADRDNGRFLTSNEEGSGRWSSSEDRSRSGLTRDHDDFGRYSAGGFHGSSNRDLPTERQRSSSTEDDRGSWARSGNDDSSRRHRSVIH